MSILDTAIAAELEAHDAKLAADAEAEIQRMESLRTATLDAARTVVDTSPLAGWLPDVAWNILATERNGTVVLVAPADSMKYPDLRLLLEDRDANGTGHGHTVTFIHGADATSSIPHGFRSKGRRVAGVRDLALAVRDAHKQDAAATTPPPALVDPSILGSA